MKKFLIKVDKVFSVISVIIMVMIFSGIILLGMFKLKDTLCKVFDEDPQTELKSIIAGS